jgi:hypothetical protein
MITRLTRLTAWRHGQFAGSCATPAAVALSSGPAPRPIPQGPMQLQLPILLLVLLLGPACPAHGVAAPGATAGSRPLPPRRSVMTLLVEHRTQFPEMVDKIAATHGGINVAAPICFNPGHIAPTTNLSSPFCLADFLVPMRARVPTITQHPMIQMANEVLLYNLKHYGWTVKAFKQVAMQYDDLIDGFLFYPQLASKVGHTGDYKALRTMLDLFADELHAINKTLGVFTPNYHSKFSPAAVLEGSRIDYCGSSPSCMLRDLRAHTHQRPRA